MSQCGNEKGNAYMAYKMYVWLMNVLSVFMWLMSKNMKFPCVFAPMIRNITQLNRCEQCTNILLFPLSRYVEHKTSTKISFHKR